MGLESYGIASPKMINSADETVFILERVSDAFPVIDIDKKSIHEGTFFETSVHATLSAGATYNIVLTTNASRYIHYRASRISCSADKLKISLYEDCTVTAGATVTPYNHNRNCTAATTVIIVKTANVTADGTLILQSFIGGGTAVGGNYMGGEGERANGWILKQSTNYCLRLENGSSGSNIVNVNQVWYEELKG